MSSTSIGQPGLTDRNDDTAPDKDSQKTLGEDGGNGGSAKDRHAMTEDLLLQRLQQAPGGEQGR